MLHVNWTSDTNSLNHPFVRQRPPPISSSHSTLKQSLAPELLFPLFLKSVYFNAASPAWSVATPSLCVSYFAFISLVPLGWHCPTCSDQSHFSWAALSPKSAILVLEKKISLKVKHFRHCLNKNVWSIN